MTDCSGCLVLPTATIILRTSLSIVVFLAGINIPLYNIDDMPSSVARYLSLKAFLQSISVGLLLDINVVVPTFIPPDIPYLMLFSANKTSSGLASA